MSREAICVHGQEREHTERGRRREAEKKEKASAMQSGGTTIE
jgi:hypothetical protein